MEVQWHLQPDHLAKYSSPLSIMGWMNIGKSFGVLKAKGPVEIEVSLPRTESKSWNRTSRGSPSTSIPIFPFPKPRLGVILRSTQSVLDPLTGELLDPHGGMQRTWMSVSCATSVPPLWKTPCESCAACSLPLASTWHLAQETIELCRTIDLEGLAPERIFEEWKKLLLKGKTISRGLNFLRDTTWLRFFPELEALVDCHQDPEWHPEGDVWVHTLHCMDAFRR